VFCQNDELKPKGGIPVCLYQHLWHAFHPNKGDPYLGEPLPSIHNYDIPSRTVTPELLNVQNLAPVLEESTQEPSQELPEVEEPEQTDESDSDSEDEIDATNVKIRNSMIRDANLVIPEPVKSQGTPTPITATQHITVSAMTTTTTTATSTQATSTRAANAATIIQGLNNAFDTTLSRNPPGGGGGGGGGGSGGGSGGGGNPPAAALQPIPQATDVRSMGKQPESFYGDRTKAEEFIEEVQGYLRLNADVAGLNSPRNKIAFTLTCMKGLEVAGWTKSIGQMLDRLNPDQNVPLLWDHFLQEFDRQYMDTTRENRARNELESLTMKDNDINTYITKFEELSRQANYTIGNEQSVQLFEWGLSQPVLADCVRAPSVHGYNAIKE
jgi:hypothetical protein